MTDHHFYFMSFLFRFQFLFHFFLNPNFEYESIPFPLDYRLLSVDYGLMN